jgi:hypothetical protein
VACDLALFGDGQRCGDDRGQVLEALHDGRLPPPAEMLANDEGALRGVGLSRAKAVYLRGLAACLIDRRLDLERLRALDDDAARNALTQANGVGRFMADGVLMLSLRRRDIWLAPTWHCGARLGARRPAIPRRGGRPRRALPAVAHIGRCVPLTA